MKYTVFSSYQDDELINFSTHAEGRSDLEVELAQRLQLALDMLTELEGESHPLFVRRKNA